ncbi:MAG: hypothetical protein Q9159_004246, partial [Coniocarpon cinnabarinum]
MAPPDPDRNTELHPHKRIQEVATLAPTRFKAFIALINHFIDANAEACEDTPRKWEKMQWRGISAQFVAEFGEQIWDERRENVRMLKEEDKDNSNGVAKSVESQGEREGSTANGIANGDATSPPATPKKLKHEQGFKMLDEDDALIFPRDADTITFIVFNMLKIQSMKHFSHEQVKKRKMATGEYGEPESSEDEKEKEKEKDDKGGEKSGEKKKGKRGRKPGSGKAAKKVKMDGDQANGVGDGTPTPTPTPKTGKGAKKEGGKVEGGEKEEN